MASSESFLVHLKSQSDQGLSLSLYIKSSLSFLLFILTFLWSHTVLTILSAYFFAESITSAFLSVCGSEVNNATRVQASVLTYVLLEKARDFLFFPTAENSTKMYVVL